jgi:uncharacterized protein HemY
MVFSAIIAFNCTLLIKNKDVYNGQYLIKTIEMNPKDREAYSILTKLYLKEKSYENAAKTITDCLNECDPTGDTCYLAAMAYKPLDKEEYISYLSNAIKHYQSLSRPVQAVKDELNNARDWD